VLTYIVETKAIEMTKAIKYDKGIEYFRGVEFHLIVLQNEAEVLALLPSIVADGLIK
jgi:ethanolamine utilization protein EutP (predicted NTPase)